MSRNRHTTKALIPALTVLVAGLIGASPAAAKGVPTGHLPKLVVDGKAETFPIAIADGGIIFLYFSRPVIDIKKTRHFAHRYIPSDQVVILTPRKRSKRARKKRPVVTGTIALKTGDYTAHLKLSTATELDWLEPAYAIKHRTEEEALQLRIANEVKRQTAIIEGIARDSFEDEAAKRFTERMARSQHLFPVTESVRRSSDKLAIEFSSASWTGNKLYLAIDVNNETGQPVPLDHLQVNDRNDVAHASQVMALFPEIEKVDGKRFLGTGREARVVLEVPGATAGDFTATRVALNSVTGKQLAWAAVDAWQGNPLFRPKTKAELERERRDQEALGRVTLQVQPMFGAMWLGNPLQNGVADTASMAGVSVRAAYGFNRYLSVEGEIAGASSGDAHFSGMSYEGVSGELTRRARIGRAQFGGLLRLGYRFIPTLRLGLGFQGADHGSNFVVDGGGSMNVPGDGYEFTTLLNFGAGFDVRLSGHFLAGVAAVVCEPLNGPAGRTVSFGLHLGYGWTPGRRTSATSGSPLSR